MHLPDLGPPGEAYCSSLYINMLFTIFIDITNNSAPILLFYTGSNRSDRFLDLYLQIVLLERHKT